MAYKGELVQQQFPSSPLNFPTSAPTPTPTPTTPTAPPPPTTNSQQSAYDLFMAVLRSYAPNLGDAFFGQDLIDVIKNAVVQGYTPDQIDLIAPELQKTESWKHRFPGWDSRIANKYNQISVGQYLQLEDQYHRILQESGLPAGFYDDPSDFGKWIGDNTSPDEIRDRVNIAAGEMRKVDPTARNMLTKFYGVTSGDLTAYFLDDKRALPTLDRQYKAVNVAAWAARNGLNTDNVSRYEDLVDKGVTADQAAGAYGTIAALNESVGKIASIYGETYDQTDAENDVFFGQSEKRKRLVTQEQATFRGSSKGSTGTANRASY